jgi:hypothetical protein
MGNGEEHYAGFSVLHIAWGTWFDGWLDGLHETIWVLISTADIQYSHTYRCRSHG